MLPLATSSSGNPQIHIEILNKASQNFNVSQPRPSTSNIPVLDFRAYENILPDEFPSFLLPEDWKAAQYLQSQPTFAVVPANLNRVAAKLDGVDWDVKYQPLHSQLFINNTPLGFNTTSPWADELFAPGYSLPMHTYPGFPGAVNNIVRRTLEPPIGDITMSSTQTFADTNIPIDPNRAAPGVIAVPYVTMNFAFTIASSVPPPVPNGNETIVLFNCRTIGIYGQPDFFSTQSDHMYRTLKFLAKQYTWGVNDALLFTLVHKSTELPVAYLKLYFEGFFTTSNTTTVVSWRLFDYKLSFYSVTNRNAIIPNPPASFQRNHMLVSQNTELVTLRQQVQQLLRNYIQPGSRQRSTAVVTLKRDRVDGSMNDLGESRPYGRSQVDCSGDVSDDDSVCGSRRGAPNTANFRD